MSVLAPVVTGASRQLPTATVEAQLTSPSLTVTLPVGVPPEDVTEKLMVTACPRVDGSGVCKVITVVVAFLSLTLWSIVLPEPL